MNKLAIVLIFLILISIVATEWHASDKSMREYDNQVSTCYTMAESRKLEQADYLHFFVDCLDVSR